MNTELSSRVSFGNDIKSARKDYKYRPTCAGEGEAMLWHPGYEETIRKALELCKSREADL